MKHGLKIETPADRRYFIAVTKLLKSLNSLYTEGNTCGKTDEDIYEDITEIIMEFKRLKEGR